MDLTHTKHVFIVYIRLLGQYKLSLSVSDVQTVGIKMKMKMK